jgi:hypothetical protein
MLHKEFNNGLRAYPIHQAVQAMGSTASLVARGVLKLRRSGSEMKRNAGVGLPRQSLLNPPNSLC